MTPRNETFRSGRPGGPDGHPLKFDPSEPREGWEHRVDLYVARQPILDRSRRTYAYEILFCDGLVNAFSAEDPDLATARVIDTSFFVLGIESLTGGRLAEKVELDHAHVENIIKHEVSLTLKLLTHRRTAARGFCRPIESIQHAILLLGDQELRKWASVVALAALGSDQPNELVVASLVRTSFCEGLLHDMGLGDLAQDGFFLSLFSTIDAFLGRPLPEAVDRLPVSEEVRTAPVGGDNALRVYDVVLARERGAWDEVSLAAARLGPAERGDRCALQERLEFGNSVALVEGRRPARV
jgi:c-di-GMP-related signal transduction protein